jgi:predicted TPR repeat methyltransferase
LDAVSYEKKTLLSILIGEKCDKIIGELISGIKNRKILELGCGTGRYTKIYYEDNDIKCIDINPHLFELGNVPVIKGNVTELDNLLGKDERFDYITSFWMSEYLTEKELTQTLTLSAKFLNPNGLIIFTFISNGLIGRLYIAGAKIKGIPKYKYSNDKIYKIAGNAGLEIVKNIPVRRFGFELGKLVVLKATNNT